LRQEGLLRDRLVQRGGSIEGVKTTEVNPKRGKCTEKTDQKTKI